jgi:hypothetical protein
VVAEILIVIDVPTRLIRVGRTVRALFVIECEHGARMANYYVALNACHFPGPRSMTMGDVVLKPDLAMPRESLKALVQHEASSACRG